MWTIEDWAADIQASRPFGLTQTISVRGVRSTWAEPGMFARVDVTAEPAEQLVIATTLPRDILNDEDTALFLREAVFGVLDALLTSPLSPVVGVRLTVDALYRDPLRSSQAAFRLAGRDAGAKILDAASGKLRRLTYGG